MAAPKRLLSRFKRKPEVSGVSVAILQKRLERYSDDRLNVAMSRALGRKHDERTFFALSIFDGDGAVIKIDRLIIGIQHFDRRIDGAYLGNNELPAWAEHSAHSVIEFKCPGGLPEADGREAVYGLLGLICVELVDANVTGLVFVNENVIAPNSPATLQGLRSYRPLNPKSLVLSDETVVRQNEKPAS
jgi:hypothetical protein